MTTEALSWSPGLNPAEGAGRNYNTFRQILTLGVGDSIDLSRVVSDALSIKFAYVWRTKDGWEVRLTTYSGAYGFSIEAEELKKNNAIFDNLLMAGDVDPPFPDIKECACTCGGPCKSETYLPGHEQREKLLIGEVEAPMVSPVEMAAGEEVDEESAEPPVEASEPEVVPDTEGDVDQPSDTEESAPDATPTPEPAPEPEPPKRDAYGEYFMASIVSAPQSAPQADIPEVPQFLTREILDKALDGMLDPAGYTPEDAAINVGVAMLGVRDGYASVTPFPNKPKCGCGCGAPRFESRYLPGHETRHRFWLVQQARTGDRRAYSALRDRGWLRYLYPKYQMPTGADHPYDPTRVPAGLPITGEAFRGYRMLDPGPGSIEAKTRRLTTRRDASRSPVARALLNEAIFRLRGGLATAPRMRPSDDRERTSVLAFRLAAADVGVIVGPNIQWQVFGSDVRERIQSEWQLRKQAYMRDAAVLMDYADLDEPLVVTAGKISAAVQRRAIQAGLEGPAPYKYALRFPTGNPKFQPDKIASGEDEEQFAPIQESEYSRYREFLEFSGEDFDPMAKFFNFLAMEIKDGRGPKWAGDGDPWDAAREAIAKYAFKSEFAEYWSGWWLTHGYKAAIYNADFSYMSVAKNARDYMATKTLGAEAVRVGEDPTRNMTLEPQVLTGFGERGRVMYLSNTPFDNDVVYMQRGDVFTGWATVSADQRGKVLTAMVGAGALERPTSWKPTGLPKYNSWADDLIDKGAKALTMQVPLGGGSMIEFVPDPSHKAGHKGDSRLWDSVRGEWGLMKFYDVSPEKVVRWLTETFGSSLEPVVPYNRFGVDGFPSFPQDSWADGTHKVNLGRWGLVYQTAGGAKRLAEIVNAGAVRSLRHSNKKSPTAKNDVGSGIDDYVFASFTMMGGAEHLRGAENLFVMKSDILMGKGVLFSNKDSNYMKSWGGSFGEPLPVDQIADPAHTERLVGGTGEVGVPHELRLEDAVALVVPDTYADNKTAVQAIAELQRVNPQIEVYFVDGTDVDRRAKAREVILRYNRTNGFAPLDVGPDRGMKPDDIVVSGVYPMEVTRTEPLHGRLHPTPTLDLWMKGEDQDSINWLANAVRDGILSENREIQEVKINPNHVVWFSPKLES